MQEFIQLTQIECISNKKSLSELCNNLDSVVYYSYFRLNTNFYFLVFARSKLFSAIISDLLDTQTYTVKKIVTRTRPLRSLRGFFSYILELKSFNQEFEILSTNLSPDFWDNVEIVLRSKNKARLNEFLFFKTNISSKNFISQQLKDFKTPLITGLKINNNQFEILFE